MDNSQYVILKPIDESSENLLDDIDKLTKIDELLRQNLGLELAIAPVINYQRIQKLIVDEGITSIMSMTRLQESVLPPVNDEHRAPLIKMITDSIQNILPFEEIIIIDNYIFPKKLIGDSKDEYLHTINQIFNIFVSKINSIVIITKNDYNRDLYNEFAGILSKLNNKTKITIEVSDRFHDRFWIFDRNKGLFIGTSLNGIGKKYSLIDYISENDVVEIIKYIEKERLIQPDRK